MKFCKNQPTKLVILFLQNRFLSTNLIFLKIPKMLINFISHKNLKHLKKCENNLTSMELHFIAPPYPHER
jgi:hypothetical protein